MSDGANNGRTPEQRRRASILIQTLGILDIVAGAACAALGPIAVGGDPATNAIWIIMGGVLALGGIAIWWFGRFRLGRRAAEDGVVSVDDRSV